MLLGVAVAALGGRAMGLARNTLQNNGRWRVTKTEAEISILGARSFYSGRQALAGGTLNLGAWHGFQQVVYRDPLDLAALEVDFRLTPGAYLTVLFAGDLEGGFAGIRMSAHEGFAPAFLKISPTGEFQRREAVDVPFLEPGTLHHLRLEIDRPVRVTLDGKPIGRFEVDLDALQRVGLRGSRAHAFVDHVKLERRRGLAIRETFAQPPSTRRWSLLAGLVLLALPFALVAGNRATPRRALLLLATVELMALVALVAALPVAARVETGYPKKSAELLKLEEQARREMVENAQERTRKAHPVPLPAATARLVFIGSSQTEGVGAKKVDDTWVRRIERRLNQTDHGGLRWECVNAGVSSARSYHLTRAVERTWLRLEPRALVINLSSNDRRVDVFIERVGRMITGSREAGVTPLLLLEPNSPEHYRGSVEERHAALRRLSERLSAPLVDMQSQLDGRYDEGFLWWDHVHLTSFGQRLMADAVYAALVDHGIVPAPVGGSGSVS
jgi:lysophospholipase L1-like esterase